MMKQKKFWIAVVLVLGIGFIFVGALRSVRADASALTAIDAAATFNSKCAKCHGHDGRGKTLRGKFTHARDLTDAGWQSDVSDERLFNSINNGRGKMPSFKKQLSESDIEALVGYVRRLKK